ncbi:uncharacterized protein LOC111631083 [Centruroides sculpturatus]|uniref:uncharacterized protein LOC111631083 n=1 Tax=Centruroides sculpturatus TaxID=218467 RepID=UPI000C6DBD3D|nr:uncharacterized protein LOC111631083 [Centruroides sculpturatus]
MKVSSPPSNSVRISNSQLKEQLSDDKKSTGVEDRIVFYEVSKDRTNIEIITVSAAKEDRKEHSTKFVFYFIKTLLIMFAFTQALILIAVLILAIQARPEVKILEKSETMTEVDIKELARMARNYDRLVNKEGKCSKPVAKLIPVSQSPDKIYKPHCAILHRCSNDTGCCHSDKKICTAAKTENVTLPFKVRELLKTGNYSERLVLLPFVNHTKCACKSLFSDPIS